MIKQTLLTVQYNLFDLIIAGDFNIDMLNENESRIIRNFFREIYCTQISPNTFSTNYKTQLDIVFSNNLNIKSEYFECVFSYHKVMWILFGSNDTFTKVSFLIIFFLHSNNIEVSYKIYVYNKIQFYSFLKKQTVNNKSKQ